MNAPPLLDLSRQALFADLDGTLTAIRPNPGDVGPDAARARLLHRLTEALGGALAIVSGRGLDDLDRILGGEVLSVGAVHGLELRRPDGQVERFAPPLPAEVGEAIAAFVAAWPPLTAEDKGLSIALHYRADPSAAEACVLFAQTLADAHGLTLQPGDMVVELRAPGPGKGGSVAAFLEAAPFSGRTPVFIGDDFTDESGFDTAQRLGGFGVIVGPRRPTNAVYALDDVASALNWLEMSIRAPAGG
jgi:trehalose 6-phosphate phosphatase